MFWKSSTQDEGGDFSCASRDSAESEFCWRGVEAPCKHWKCIDRQWECFSFQVKNSLTHLLENRMESFFLAETSKYLYLLFDVDNFVHNLYMNHDSRNVTTKDGYTRQCFFDAGLKRFSRNSYFSSVLCAARLITLQMEMSSLIKFLSKICQLPGGYVFNTEAHLIDIALLDCCRSENLAFELQSTTARKSRRERQRLINTFSK